MIIEINNSEKDGLIGVVLDTGGGMIQAYKTGWTLLDLAYESESKIEIGINKKTLPRVIDDLVQNQDKLLNIKDNCKKIKKTFVLEKFYEVLSKVPKANYLDIQHVTDSKKTVIKKVDKARKLAIKQNKVKK